MKLPLDRVSRLLAAQARVLRGRWTSRWTPLVPVVFAIAGLIASTSAYTARGTNLRAESRLSTQDLIVDQQRRVAKESKVVAELQRQVEKSALAAAPSGSALAKLNRSSQELAPGAGLAPVQGVAVEVELNDAPANSTLPTGISADDLVVHQQDVQSVVNALWAAGAEEMMLMDQRVISTSAVRCVGNVLNLQGRLYSPPYKITAIGDPAALELGLEASPAVETYRDYARKIGLGYQVRRIKKAIFPGYTGAISLQYSKVTGEDL